MCLILFPCGINNVVVVFVVVCSADKCYKTKWVTEWILVYLTDSAVGLNNWGLKKTLEFTLVQMKLLSPLPSPKKRNHWMQGVYMITICYPGLVPRAKLFEAGLVLGHIKMSSSTFRFWLALTLLHTTRPRWSPTQLLILWPHFIMFSAVWCFLPQCCLLHIQRHPLECYKWMQSLCKPLHLVSPLDKKPKGT